MRKKYCKAAAMLAALSCASAGAVTSTKDWGAYGNNRFNFAVCFPPAFRGEGEATNGDGERFRTKDGAELVVFGTNEEAGAKLGEYLTDSIEEVAGKGARTTYRAQKQNWLVVSGLGPKGEFYIKRFLRQDQMLTFELIYPTRLHARYAPLVAPMVSCFTIGSDPGY